MAKTPRPAGWEGGSEDFTFVRTLDGHRGINQFTDADCATDECWRRNARTFDEANLGGAYDLEGEY